MYSTGPFFRTFFETLGVPKDNIVWSNATTEESWAEGGRYGSIDPCFPSKVTQSHIHELLNHAHTDPKRGPLNFIYYPCLTHVPNWVSGTSDNTSCPIVAGNPNVLKAAFTKETNFFEKAGIEYLDAALSFSEPNLMKRRLFEVWGPRLGVTEDEVEFAADQGHIALAEFDRLLQVKGKEILEQVEREHRLAVLVIGRPYHNDPGLNHGIPEEFQVLGYPILSMRSIPKDPAWLAKWYQPGEDPLGITDVWPENFSANSAQRVWAVKFASRHPNVAILDLSSFKCGHDAPTYGIVEKIVGIAKVPYSALHDIDANKPGGSIAIRVKTYVYRLKRIEEDLKDQSHKRVELARRVAERRRELESIRRGDSVAAK
jgi:predicted nucleotide-binding protein (sugar kinase/HSP70/actin superfamily)